MIICLTLRNNLLNIFRTTDSAALCLGSIRLIGEMCFHFDSEAVNFIYLDILQIIKEKLQNILAGPHSVENQKIIEILKGEICWVLSNLKQDKINVALLAADKTNLYQILSELLHMSNITTRYEVVYLVSFYMKGLEF